MKRGGWIKRKTPLRSKAELARTPMQRRRSGLPRRQKEIPKRNAKRAKQRRERDFGEQAELARRSPCCACGSPPPSEPAHVRSRGAGGTAKDIAALCSSCHHEQHRHGIKTFQERHGVDLAAEAAKLAERVREAS